MRPGPMAPWRVLRTAEVCCVERIPGTAGVAGVRGYLWARVRWVFGSSGVGVFCARFRVFLFVMRWIIPLCLILTAFFPLSRSAPKPCAETSYLRVQCLCGRADVWSARAVGATILDVFGYGLPTESGVGSQWRYCYCRGREVGNHSEKDIGPLGKICLYPPFSP